MIHHLQSTLERLEGVLDDAIAAMVRRTEIDDAAVATAKGRALLALARLSGDISPTVLPDEVKALIGRVREKLTHEHHMMERRLEASQLVVRLIGDAVIAQESDGTYGPVPLHRAAPVAANANERSGR